MATDRSTDYILPREIKRSPGDVKLQQVAVIIAAWNAERTVGRAIASALRQQEVGEVFVVDDASTDSTATSALEADDGTGRIRLIRLARNMGPAHARNLALNATRLPFISPVDADDFLMDGRYGNLLATDGWDMAADNIVFIDAANNAMSALPSIEPSNSPQEWIDLEHFILGNIAKRRSQRSELGFLKPVIRRSFLEQHGLRYDETLRLGEDYDLYARALMHKARFAVTRSCGYAALVRQDSLSARHKADDLERLVEVDHALLAALAHDDTACTAILLHERQTHGKFVLRRFLDIKAQSGLRAAASFACNDLRTLHAVVRGVVKDKVRSIKTGIRAVLRTPRKSGLPRYLMATEQANRVQAARRR